MTFEKQRFIEAREREILIGGKYGTGFKRMMDYTLDSLSATFLILSNFPHWPLVIRRL